MHTKHIIFIKIKKYILYVTFLWCVSSPYVSFDGCCCVTSHKNDVDRYSNRCSTNGLPSVTAGVHAPARSVRLRDHQHRLLTSCSLSPRPRCELMKKEIPSTAVVAGSVRTSRTQTMCARVLASSPLPTHSTPAQLRRHLLAEAPSDRGRRRRQR